MHDAGFAHLDIKIDNVFLDIVHTDDPNYLGLSIKIADFGYSQANLHEIGALPAMNYRAPEVYNLPYDGEKADVFASAFILMAMYSTARLGDKE